MEDVMTDQNPKTETNANNSAENPGVTPSGGNRRDVRRLAMQVLYQMDVTGVRDREAIIDGLDNDFDNPRVREQGTDLAINAWANHKEADEKIAELAPEWPTHRQPPVDRAILRLAFHEITSGHAPPPRWRSTRRSSWRSTTPASKARHSSTACWIN